VYKYYILKYKVVNVCKIIKNIKMNNILNLIKSLEAKLLKTNLLKSKVKILNEINILNKQLTTFK
jgi:hypothetical protein